MEAKRLVASKSLDRASGIRQYCRLDEMPARRMKSRDLPWWFEERITTFLALSARIVLAGRWMRFLQTVSAGRQSMTRITASRSRWIDHWEPENQEFWEKGGRSVARRNLIWSILAENLGFSVWLIWSVTA